MFLKSLLSNLYSPMEGSGKLFGPVTGMLHSLQSYQLVLVSKRTSSFVRPTSAQAGRGGDGEVYQLVPPPSSTWLPAFCQIPTWRKPARPHTLTDTQQVVSICIGRENRVTDFSIVVVVVTKPRKPRQK